MKRIYIKPENIVHQLHSRNFFLVVSPRNGLQRFTGTYAVQMGGSTDLNSGEGDGDARSSSSNDLFDDIW